MKLQGRLEATAWLKTVFPLGTVDVPSAKTGVSLSSVIRFSSTGAVSGEEESGAIGSAEAAAAEARLELEARDELRSAAKGGVRLGEPCSESAVAERR